MLLSSLGGSIYQFIVVLVIFIGVLVLTGFATKWIASYMHNQNFHSNSNFEVIDAFNLSPNHRLQIIKVGKERYYVIALGKETTTLLGEISKEELKEISSNATTKRDFNDILKKFNLNKQTNLK